MYVSSASLALRAGDGTDISWINEVNFERLASAEGRILVSGTRADDMARRLNSAGIDPDRVKILRDYISVLDDMPPEGDVYIMPTYTAMLDFREVISKRYGLKAFWE